MIHKTPFIDDKAPSMTQIMHGKLGADMIDTTRKIWSAQDDPTSDLWVPPSGATWRENLRERMRDEYDAGLDGGEEREIEQPLYED